MRKKWKEKVEFIECSMPGDGTRKKIIMFNGENGDLYLTVCPETHRGGVTIRLERSGGAITQNPKMMTALSNAYDAIAGNELNDTKTTTFSPLEIEGKILLKCKCGYKIPANEEYSLSERDINYCPKCGKKII